MKARNPTAICPSVERAFELLSRKWTGLIVHVLSGGPRYFCELEKAIGSVSARMLTARMKELETEQILRRRVQISSPVRVRYSLTAKGRALQPAMRALEQWARKWVKG
jgi:DNA-binding HxlR family transcriptional regulator